MNRHAARAGTLSTQVERRCDGPVPATLDRIDQIKGASDHTEVSS